MPRVPTIQQAAVLALLDDEGPLEAREATRDARPSVSSLPQHYDDAHARLKGMAVHAWVVRDGGRPAKWSITDWGKLALEYFRV